MTEAEILAKGAERQMELVSAFMDCVAGMGKYQPDEVMQAVVWMMAKLSFDDFDGDKVKGRKLRDVLGKMYWRVYGQLAEAHRKRAEEIAAESTKVILPDGKKVQLMH